jgi:formylglycine-generating enzyme required for sulfatase activity
LDPSGRESAYISLGRVFINLDAGAVAYAYPHPESGHTVQEWYAAALAYIHYHRQLILLGDPGSGKSTLLRFLAYCLAQAALQPAAAWLTQLKWTHQLLEAEGEVSELIGAKRGASFTLRPGAERSVQEIEKHWSADTPIPIFVELRDFARTNFDSRSPLALWHFVSDRLEREGLAQAISPLQAMAQRGRAIFLLDGVDEAPAAQRPFIWQAIAALADGPYGGNRWVATCRLLSFVPGEAPRAVPDQTLQPLKEAQIDAFVHNWYDALAEAGELSPEQAATMAGRLQNAARRPRLQPLAQNPMLLTIMALVQTYHGTLPDERAKLYQACVETLLLRWQRHKEADAAGELPDVLAHLSTTKENLERLLWQIAWEAHSKADDREDAADIPEMAVLHIARQHLGNFSRAEQFLAYTERRAHLLLGRGGAQDRVYTFPHRTFQEYLAACHLAASRRFPQEAARLATQSPTWREVLNLAAGTLVFNQNNREKALDGVEKVLPAQTPALEDEAGWSRVWLAAEMLAVVGREAAEQDEVGRELLPRLRQQLVALLANGRLTPRQRAEAGDALGLLGDPRPGICTLEPDMIPIPAGPFLMGDEALYEVHVDAFAIARYPITNAQFRYFVADGGYTDKWRNCWTEEGWHYRQQYGWTEPGSWDDERFSQANQPVVDVSWYEAVAYCNWLSRKTGKPYRLPTEAEWERAARHTDGRQYPWGNTWLEGAANSEEAGIGRPSAVGAFPAGAAACGALDMSGNVWEWCSTRYDDENNKPYLIPYRADDGREEMHGSRSRSFRVVRGGAFWNELDALRCVYRYWHYPHYWYYRIGFRLVASPFPPLASEPTGPLAL